MFACNSSLHLASLALQAAVSSQIRRCTRRFKNIDRNFSQLAHFYADIWATARDVTVRHSNVSAQAVLLGTKRGTSVVVLPSLLIIAAAAKSADSAALVARRPSAVHPCLQAPTTAAYTPLVDTAVSKTSGAPEVAGARRPHAMAAHGPDSGGVEEVDILVRRGYRPGDKVLFRICTRTHAHTRTSAAHVRSLCNTRARCTVAR